MNSIERHPKQKELLRPLRFFAGGIATRPSFSPSKHPQKRTTATPPLFPSPIHLSKTLLAQTPHPPHQNPAKKKKNNHQWTEGVCRSLGRPRASVGPGATGGVQMPLDGPAELPAQASPPPEPARAGHEEDEVRDPAWLAREDQRLKVGRAGRRAMMGSSFWLGSRSDP